MGDGPTPDRGEEPLPDEVSLEDLSAAFARAAAQHELTETDRSTSQSEALQSGGSANALNEHGHESADDESADDLGSDSETSAVTPEAIIEAALFVGHPKNVGFSEQRLASLMRGVTPAEVRELISELNQSYRDTNQALRIVTGEGGYRMAIAPELESLRNSFLGKVRETRLSQLAVDVLSLIAYQPGLTALQIRDQRGRDCGTILNQLVRRQLVVIQRQKTEDSPRAVAHYYPTERFLHLFGLESLEDLPQVESTNLPTD